MVSSAPAKKAGRMCFLMTHNVSVEPLTLVQSKIAQYSGAIGRRYKLRGAVEFYLGQCELHVFRCSGQCSKSCGDGVQTRSFTISALPQHGGAACPTDAETRPCNVGECKQDCVFSYV